MPKPGTLEPLLQAFSGKAPGATAAPVKVGELIAEGGMGTVHFAEQEALGRAVVIKTMREDFALSAAEHILREAWATGALEHPNIVPVHDIRVSDDGAPMIVLKRIEGDSWTKLMHDEERLRESFAAHDCLTWNLNILAQVLQAVRFAHSRGILHRDLKPDNVMIGAYGEVYLVDWGIALSLGEESTSPLPSASASTEMCGTPCYMAPEMLGGVALDARTDIYLIGGLLCEILTGMPPHRTGCLADLMEDIHTSTPDLPEDAPPALVAIIRRAMAPDRADRFQDASALANALQGFQQTRGSQLLADQAEAPLRDLLACLAADNVDQQEVYRLFGAVRFGYETAVNAWPENKRAATDLDRARVALIEYELSQQHPEAAKALFRDIKTPDPKLGERIADAIESRRLEEEELARFRDDSDVRFGTRTRIALTLILGGLWSGLALLKHYYFDGVAPSYPELFAVTGFFAAVVLGLFYWARRSMRRTEMNRRISRLVLIVLPAHVVLFTGAQVMGMPPATAEIFNMLLWAIVAMAGAATLDARFWPLALAYAATFVYAASHPEHRYLAMAAGTLAFVIVGLVVWNGPTKTSLDAPSKS
tara:strand:- start:103348 stop:105126 length:1779 start_codon:yes stop_codon:yes gene_type:complete